MSVVIRGMGIPKTCGDCPCYEIEEGFCKVTYDDVSCLQISKQGNCPLVELPVQHGRLIDADALITTFCEWGTRLERSRKLVITMCEAKQAIVDIIEDAPTIIEAEVSE